MAEKQNDFKTISTAKRTGHLRLRSKLVVHSLDDRKGFDFSKWEVFLEKGNRNQINTGQLNDICCYICKGKSRGTHGTHYIMFLVKGREKG